MGNVSAETIGKMQNYIEARNTPERLGIVEMVSQYVLSDLPPEEDAELCDLCISKGVSFIRLAPPTTTDARLKVVLQKTSGFLYYLSITGLTGSKEPQIALVEQSVKNIKNKSNIPVGVGFGIKSKKDIKEVSKFADAVIVGSAIVSPISEENDKDIIKKNITTAKPPHCP